LYSYKNTYEIEPTIKRVSQGLTFLTYTNFCDIITSRDAYYADMLNRRIPSYRPGHLSFTYSTQVMLKEFINT